MNWHPQNDEVRSSGWSRVPECADGEEVEDGSERSSPVRAT